MICTRPPPFGHFETREAARVCGRLRPKLRLVHWQDADQEGAHQREDTDRVHNVKFKQQAAASQAKCPVLSFSTETLEINLTGRSQLVTLANVAFVHQK